MKTLTAIILAASLCGCATPYRVPPLVSLHVQFGGTFTQADVATDTKAYDHGTVKKDTPIDQKQEGGSPKLSIPLSKIDSDLIDELKAGELDRSTFQWYLPSQNNLLSQDKLAIVPLSDALKPFARGGVHPQTKNLSARTGIVPVAASRSFTYAPLPDWRVEI